MIRCGLLYVYGAILVNLVSPFRFITVKLTVTFPANSFEIIKAQGYLGVIQGTL
jgi:hypothetical protein